MNKPIGAPSISSRRATQGFIHDIARRLGTGRLAGCVAVVLLCTVAESFGLLALVPLLQVLNGQASGQAISWLAQQGLKPELGTLLLAFIALMLARAWLGRRRDLLLLALRLDYVDALRHEVEASLAAASWRYLVKLRHAEVMHLLYDQLARVSQGVHHALQLLSGAGLGLASLVVTFVVAPAWSLLLLLPLVLLAFAMRGQLNRSSQLGMRMSQGQLELMSSSRDFLAGLKMVKVHGKESVHVGDLQRRSTLLHLELLGFARNQSNTRGWFELCGAIVLSGYLYAMVNWGQARLPELILTILAFSRLMPVLRDGQLQLQQLLHTMPGFSDAIDWIARNRAAAETVPKLESSRLNLTHELQLEGIGFSYDDHTPLALHALSLSLAAGTCTALTGPSGSGKTTLADLALGLLQPASGTISVDGADLSSPQVLRRWRQSVAYVAQDTYLFPASIRNNLCWLAGQQPDGALWQALDQADAATFVAALPGGLDHHLGERGEGFSGGQRQRLALARALLCQPALLVLDEVTSHLDAESEERVNAAIRRLRGSTTILLIAHRPSALAPAERVLVLEAGRIVSDTPN